jgi:hypothetical protein
MTPAIIPDKVYILHAIDVVLNECIKSQLTSPDVAVGEEIQELQRARFAVEQQWPLPDASKAQITIGPTAARNITDWNQPLATALMLLDHVLINDGDMLYRLLGPPPA